MFRDLGSNRQPRDTIIALVSAQLLVQRLPASPTTHTIREQWMLHWCDLTTRYIDADSNCLCRHLC